MTEPTTDVEDFHNLDCPREDDPDKECDCGGIYNEVAHLRGQLREIKEASAETNASLTWWQDACEAAERDSTVFLKALLWIRDATPSRMSREQMRNVAVEALRRVSET